MALPATFKTPGVYINEKNAFPNSVVGVETAVPAFIGYTETAKFKGQSLNKKPIRIDSFMEYTQYFGYGPKTKYAMNPIDAEDESKTPDVHLSGQDYELKAETNTDFNLYDSLKLFYQNGGGSCFVVSVGTYKDKVSPDFSTSPFIAGIEILEKETVPTMLVIPDAVLFEKSSDCYALQQQMLRHCGEQQNRIAILDIYDGYKEIKDFDKPIESFRNGVPSDFLSYGAAYYPWLNTSIIQATEVSFENLNTKAIGILQKVCNKALSGFDDAQLTLLKPCVDKLSGGLSVEKANENIEELEKKKGKLETAVGTKDDDILEAKEEIKQANLDIKNANVDIQTHTATPNETKLKKAKEELKTAKGNLAEAQGKLLNAKNVSKELDKIPLAMKLAENDLAVAKKEAEIESQKKDIEEKTTKKDEATDDDALKAAKTELKTSKDKLEDLKKELALLPSNLTPSTINKVLSLAIKEYKLLMETVLKKKNLMAPSAAMAGIYSSVDSQRGVWKAPANVAVSSVVSPAVLIDHKQQEDLNAPILGKAICAIRPFIGLGTMVWGARTLDANSLDWKYINVRRTMIMMEQSIKFAAKAYVFEPNVKNTWVSIQAMISNFLTNLWKLGALAGSVPEDAFSVSVGLGTTMTAIDILDGKMIIEVKVAVSRPAEFIIITFEQQMQKS